MLCFLGFYVHVKHYYEKRICLEPSRETLTNVCYKDLDTEMTFIVGSNTTSPKIEIKTKLAPTSIHI